MLFKEIDYGQKRVAYNANKFISSQMQDSLIIFEQTFDSFIHMPFPTENPTEESA